MLSYQHAFHAGNRADVLKHAVLDAFLRHLGEDDQPLLYVETHSGRGVYDLEGADARKTGEAADGVLDLLSGRAPRPIRKWLDHVGKTGAQAYPGSPALAASRLGQTTRFILFEKHPAEHAALSAALGRDTRVQIKQADGYSGALRLAPRRGERQCVFVDPSYETERDIEVLADWTPRALRRWPRALIILWLPLFKDERERDFGEFLSNLEAGVVAGARWECDADDESSLEGSSIIAFRAPEAVAQDALGAAAALQAYWSGR